MCNNIKRDFSAPPKLGEIHCNKTKAALKNATMELLYRVNSFADMPSDADMKYVVASLCEVEAQLHRVESILQRCRDAREEYEIENE